MARPLRIECAETWYHVTARDERADYSYTPDKLNRRSVTDNRVTSNYSVDAVNQANGLNQYTAIAGRAFQYDDRFNLIGYNGGTYTYDSANYLVSANNGSVQFIYDGLGRCVRRTVDGVTRLFTYDAWNPMMEWDQAGNWKAISVMASKPPHYSSRSHAEDSLAQRIYEGTMNNHDRHELNGFVSQGNKNASDYITSEPAEGWPRDTQEGRVRSRTTPGCSESKRYRDKTRSEPAWLPQNNHHI